MVNDIQTRSAALAPATLNEAGRSVKATIATEAPVLVYDWNRGQVNEILLLAGGRYPDQTVLLDSHSRNNSSDVLGSVRDFAITGSELRATVTFSQESTSVFQKVKEGHLRDVSIGYRVKKSVFIPEGENQIVEGRTFQGPVKVATAWRLLEVSVTPIGADESAKFRS